MEAGAGFRQTEILAELASERIIWLDLRRRVGRTACLDSGLNAEYAVSYDNMDDLLDQYKVSLNGRPD